MKSADSPGLIPRIKSFISLQRYIRRKFPVELALLKGRHLNSNANQSIMFFTVHRCASQFILGILRRFASETGMSHVNIESYFWKGGKRYRRNINDLFKVRGYIYGPFYGMDEEEFSLPIPRLEHFRILLMLRDPRDVLTSYYFHHGYELYGNPGKEGFVEERSKETLSKTIDEWVIEKSKVFGLRYLAYLNELVGKPNVLVSKYEDMVGDFDGWLGRVVEFMNIDLSPETIMDVIEKANFSSPKESVSAHKRQVTPGDHRRKLREETIRYLNSEFEAVLKALNYELS
jgi:hypothetical protein